MYTGNGAERALWEVMWVRAGQKVRVDFRHDLAEATRIYVKAVSAGKPGATLRCKNMGFPPPENLSPRRVRVKRKQHGRVRIVEGMVRPMKKRNLEGVFWCPYCMKLRRFKVFKYIELDGQRLRDKFLRCPMCEVGLNDFNVAKHNPMARQIRYQEEAARARSRTVKPKRRRRR